MAKETDKAELEKSVVNEVDFDEADRSVLLLLSWNIASSMFY